MRLVVAWSRIARVRAGSVRDCAWYQQNHPATRKIPPRTAPRRPNVPAGRDRQQAERGDRGQRERREQEEHGEHAVGDAADDGLDRFDRAFADEPDRVVDRVGGVGGPVAHVLVPAWFSARAAYMAETRAGPRPDSGNRDARDHRAAGYREHVCDIRRPLPEHHHGRRALFVRCCSRDSERVRESGRLGPDRDTPRPGIRGNDGCPAHTEDCPADAVDGASTTTPSYPTSPHGAAIASRLYSPRSPGRRRSCRPPLRPARSSPPAPVVPRTPGAVGVSAKCRVGLRRGVSVCVGACTFTAALHLLAQRVRPGHDAERDGFGDLARQIVAAPFRGERRVLGRERDTRRLRVARRVASRPGRR